ncbi:Uncharacterized protein Rs2_29060 [Raphanus sativus]|nr:Uncharacterized protein Rs2_29060 [Raphanus sativus]
MSRDPKTKLFQKRRFLQFDVQEFSKTFEKEMIKALKDISKIHEKSTSTRALVAEPSLFITEKSKGKSETLVEEFKYISDSLPTFGEYEEEMIESLMTCDDKCDLPSLEPEFEIDNEQANVELTVLQPELPSSLVLSPQVFEEEPLFTCLMLAHVLEDYPKSLDPVFDVLRIEKPFDYFFVRFDVVSLVVLNEQDKHDHFPRRASIDGRQRA